MSAQTGGPPTGVSCLSLVTDKNEKSDKAGVVSPVPPDDDASPVQGNKKVLHCDEEKKQDIDKDTGKGSK